MQLSCATLVVALLATLCYVDAERLGRCPTRGLRDPSQCPENRIDECTSDAQCSGESKCCTDGCRNVCVMPIMTSCERHRLETVKRARALGQNEAELLLMNCDPVGDFEPVQCNSITGDCFCVDESGFEMAGTRARSLELVNCTNPRPCAGFVCRMLCPYDFELDREGCPKCQCRDPCNGIKCPGSQTCQLEEMPCAKEPCPPVPTCKQARSLGSLCPIGTPLAMPGQDRPFLCGTDPGKPTCPPLFECSVQPGADYGVCCAAAEKLQKPGVCPASSTDTDSNSTICGVPCVHDLECQGADKCCHSDECGKHCIPPQNFTLCLQQQKIAELLSIHERSDRGYIPQCSSEGQFEKRQCSRNGLVCWCVDEMGTKVKGSMGPADSVHCESDQSNTVGRSSCDSALCAATCDYGYRVDARGCPTCECDNPCDNYRCGENERCVMERDDNCNSATCSPRPMCKRIFIEPCAFGKYLTNSATGEPVDCTVGSKFSCPSGYRCTFSIPNSANFCCPEPPKPETESLSGKNNVDIEHRLPTICELLREVALGRQPAPAGHTPAIPDPLCKPNGDFEEIQCDRKGQCWCVDEYGVEMEGTRGQADQVTSCQKSRNELECPGMICRLGCDYGFAKENATGCPLCECRDPCEAAQCPQGQQCQMVPTPCDEEPFCPALPYCVSVQRMDTEIIPSCPMGEPLIDPATNDVTTCNPRARSLACPEGYSCQTDSDFETLGFCCPVQKVVKAGQCPFLVPITADSCDYECAGDNDCDGTSKCCSNGCGTQCVEPLIKTACQHLQTIMKYRARESGIPANRVFIPRCHPDDGSFEPIQCDPVTRACWCVTEDGSEIAGTRVPPGLSAVCHKPRICPSLECNMNCEHGLEIDTSGCPVCQCRNPCDQVTCRSDTEECRMVTVNCIREPCPPLPVCLPKLENPCAYGQPLKDLKTGTSFQCGPFGSKCPSSHKCLLSPLNEFAVCCPKPRDVCLQEQEKGSCNSSLTRWHFNEKRNRCESFTYSGCGGNMNNFDSEKDCKAVCPSLSPCEKLREKNSKMAEKFKKVVFMPKCSSTGEWESIQCLEEVGICWCVDKDGESIKGTLTRGKPTCGVRQARHRALDSSICEEGVSIHVCNKTLCDNKICLADPTATCRVNPCGGCKYAFYDSNGRQVDCSAGLTTCQKDVQTVMNSDVWKKQGKSWNPLSFSTQRTPAKSRNQFSRALSLEAFEYVHTEEDAEMLPAIPRAIITVAAPRRSIREAETATELNTEPAVADVTTELPSEDATEFVTEALPSDIAREFFDTLLAVTDADVVEETTLSARSAKLLPIDSGLVPSDNSLGEETPIDSVDAVIVEADPFELGLSDKEPVSSTTHRTIPALRDAIKPGFCPPVRSRGFLRVLAQFAGATACADQCISDADCTGAQRCCPGECGSVCTNPVILLPKPGQCPAIKFRSRCSSEDSEQSECFADADCTGRSKCCYDGCRAYCTIPEEETTEPVMMSPAPPLCTLKGDYNREQTQGELSWCVDSNGNPIDDSLTRGTVRCSPNGTILEQRALGPVCSDPAVKPRVCRNECLEARCPAHPEAICVADPCNNCQISFVKPDGEPVSCTSRCSQEVESGHCRASFYRFFYNSTSEKCEEFIFGGCEGNDNNFETVEECQAECEKPVDLCELPMDTGLCRAAMDRWYYNSVTESCEMFIYGGCGGNGNNFYTKEQCERRCPAQVLCPHVSPDGEMKVCDRNAACSGLTCPGFEEASCTVDPCTCAAYFIGFEGEKVQCQYQSDAAFVPQPKVDMEPIKEVEARKLVPTTTTTTSTTTTTTAPTTTPTTEPSTTKRGKALAEGESLSRCQKLRKTHLKLGNEFVVDCDEKGKFKPMQCVPARSDQQFPRCWCVDEAGNQIPNIPLFAPGQKTCKLVPVTAVSVTLGFPAMDVDDVAKLALMEEEAKSQISQILSALSANTAEEKVFIRSEDKATVMSFTLVGDNKVDVAHYLEDMVKSGHLTLDMEGHSMAADVTSSRFAHRLDDIPRVVETSSEEPIAIAAETREIFTQALDIEAPYLAVIVVLSVLASIIICGLVIGLVLYRRKTTGMYPKGSSTFASPPMNKKSKESNEVVPRGFPRTGISPSDQQQLSPTVPRSKRFNRNAEAW